MAIERGHLYFGRYMDSECYFVTDKTRYNMDIRRLDGGVFTNGSKSYCPPGTSRTWPIGIMEAARYERIALLEGSGDFLAAHCIIHRENIYSRVGGNPSVGVVGMMGVMDIPQEVVPLFRGKHVQVFPHLDPGPDRPGYRAVQRWRNSITQAGGCVDPDFLFNGITDSRGEQVRDLNDLLRVDRRGLLQEYRIGEILR